jgi:hypothetical protein
MDVHRCLIVPTDLVEDARAMAAAASPGGVGMFVTPLYSPEVEDPTYYISCGYIAPSFAAWLDSPKALASHTGMTVEQAEAWFAACDVSADDWQTACARVGVSPVQPEIEPEEISDERMD